MEGGREGGREYRREGVQEGGREYRREGGSTGGREAGREGGREGGMKAERAGGYSHAPATAMSGNHSIELHAPPPCPAAKSICGGAAKCGKTPSTLGSPRRYPYRLATAAAL